MKVIQSYGVDWWSCQLFSVYCARLMFAMISLSLVYCLVGWLTTSSHQASRACDVFTTLLIVVYVCLRTFCRELVGITHNYCHVESVFWSMWPRKCCWRSCTVCIRSLPETDVRTVVFHTLSNCLTPVMKQYAIVAQGVDDLAHQCIDRPWIGPIKHYW